MIDLLNMVIFQSAMFNNQGAILLRISLNHCCTPFKSFNEYDTLYKAKLRYYAEHVVCIHMSGKNNGKNGKELYINQAVTSLGCWVIDNDDIPESTVYLERIYIQQRDVTPCRKQKAKLTDSHCSTLMVTTLYVKLGSGYVIFVCNGCEENTHQLKNTPVF